MIKGIRRHFLGHNSMSVRLAVITQNGAISKLGLIFILWIKYQNIKYSQVLFVKKRNSVARGGFSKPSWLFSWNAWRENIAMVGWLSCGYFWKSLLKIWKTFFVFSILIKKVIWGRGAASKLRVFGQRITLTKLLHECAIRRNFEFIGPKLELLVP